MEKREDIRFLEEQLALSMEREKALMRQLQEQSKLLSEQSAQLQSQSIQLRDQSIQINELIASIRSLEAALGSKNQDIQSLQGKNRGLGKLLGNKSEKISVPPKSPEAASIKKAISPKDRGNNGAKRKEYVDIETVIEEVFPDSPDFDLTKAQTIGHTDSILYKYVPGKFIKHISRQYNCLLNGKMYSGNAPKAPLLNSNYDSSFIAGMLQLRYIYSMSVERIVKFFTENGFEINKATAHGLIKKTAGMMERLDEVLKKNILSDDYLQMDETYYTVLTKEKNKEGKGVRKGYIWAALAKNKKLIHYFYQNGSRGKEMLTDYVGTDYKGAIQSDGYAGYKILETDTYPQAIRLSCFQHCKRKFLDIESDKEAQEIIDLINRLYSKEHQIKANWSPERILKYRQEYAPPILKKIKDKLLRIQSDPTSLPKNPLTQAANYMLNEFDALSNYILRHDYALDTNAIERMHRYISLSRKNSLFAGSHAGAERTALIYSLACSCRLHNINTFDYFTDILNRLATISPNASDEVYEELLPHRWKKK